MIMQEVFIILAVILMGKILMESFLIIQTFLIHPLG